MTHILQVGAGSGGMVVLDLLCRDERITRITLVEPDVYKAHNVIRHYFPQRDVGEKKASLAARWVRERRPDLEVNTLVIDLLDAAQQGMLEEAARAADIGVCAVDNEPAKFHFDALMRKAGKPWTLGEVLSGGIGGWVHRFTPGGPCYGCVASHLNRTVPTDNTPPPADYANPDGAVQETTVPASKASIDAVASWHALITLGLCGPRFASASTEVPAAAAPPRSASASTEVPTGAEAEAQRGPWSEEPAGAEAEAQRGPWSEDPGFSSVLVPFTRVEGVFAEPFKPYRFRIDRSPTCLICSPSGNEGLSGEALDVALDQALARLAHE